MDAIHEEEYKGYTIKIIPDDSGESPRDWDNLGKMVCFHGRYTLGDKHDIRHEDFAGWDEMERYIIKELKAVVILPLYLYDHGGISISTGTFQGRAVHADWDSGRVGFVYLDAETIKKEYSVKRISKQLKEKVEKILIAEVKTYDDFIRGDVYGYRVEDAEGNDVDSCWGYIGDYEEKGGPLDEARRIVDSHVTENSNSHVSGGI